MFCLASNLEHIHNVLHTQMQLPFYTAKFHLDITICLVAYQRTRPTIGNKYDTVTASNFRLMHFESNCIKSLSLLSSAGKEGVSEGRQLFSCLFTAHFNLISLERKKSVRRETRKLLPVVANSIKRRPQKYMEGDTNPNVIIKQASERESSQTSHSHSEQESSKRGIKKVGGRGRSRSKGSAR